jgi:hypothetical protein
MEFSAWLALGSFVKKGQKLMWRRDAPPFSKAISL